MPLRGEAGCVDALSVKKDRIALREHLKEYDTSCILNVDEPGFCYKLYPRQTYIGQHKDRQFIRRIKVAKAKDRTAGYVCASVTSIRVSMCIIEKAKSPRCFQSEQPPVSYFSQCNAGSDTKMFKEWFYHVFPPFVRQYTSKLVA